MKKSKRSSLRVKDAIDCSIWANIRDPIALAISRIRIRHKFAFPSSPCHRVIIHRNNNNNRRKKVSFSGHIIRMQWNSFSVHSSAASTSTHGGSNGAPANSNSINSNNLNGNNSSSSINHTTSNGPVNPSSNLSSSSATNNATVTSLTNGLQHENSFLNQNNVPNGDWICFNFGKELYTYSFRGVKKVR